MGQKTVKGDVGHFKESLRLVSEAYGNELAVNGIQAFEDGYSSYDRPHFR